MTRAGWFGGLWRDREFTTFWSAQTVSEFGDRITELALPLIAVTMLDATPAEVGLLTAAVWLPNIVSLFVGSWVDRQPDKRRLMVVADLARTVILLSLPIAYWLGALTLMQLYVIAILAGTAHVLFNTAYASFFAQLVKREDFLEANSKLSATRSLSSMGGPALGGVLIQFLSAPAAIFIDAVSFVFSAVQISRLKTALPPADVSEETVLQRARAGWSYLFAHPYLRPSLFCAATVNLFNLIGFALLVLFANRNLGLSAGTIGLALGIGASGGLLGAILAGRLSAWIGIGPLIAIATVVFPASMAIVAFAEGPLLWKAIALGTAEFVAGFSVMCFDVPLGALQASVTDDRMRSRVSGAFLTINYGIRPVGAVLGGLLGSWIGPRDTLLVSAVGGVLAVLFLLGTPILTTRSIDRLGPPDDA